MLAYKLLFVDTNRQKIQVDIVNISNFSLLDINLSSTESVVRKSGAPKPPVSSEFSTVYQQRQDDANQSVDRHKENEEIKNTRDEKNAENNRIAQQNSLKRTSQNNKQYNEKPRDRLSKESNEQIKSNASESERGAYVRQADDGEQKVSEPADELSNAAEDSVSETNENGQNLPYGHLSGNSLQENDDHRESNDAEISVDNRDNNESTDESSETTALFTVNNPIVITDHILPVVSKNKLQDTVANQEGSDTALTLSLLEKNSKGTVDATNDEGRVDLDKKTENEAEQFAVLGAMGVEPPLTNTQKSNKDDSTKEDVLALADNKDKLTDVMQTVAGSQAGLNITDKSDGSSSDKKTDQNQAISLDGTINNKSSEELSDTKNKSSSDENKTIQQDADANNEKYNKVLEAIGVVRNKENTVIESLGLSAANEKLNTKHDEAATSARSDSIAQLKSDHPKSVSDFNKAVSSTKVPLRDTLEIPVTHKKWGESLAEKTLMLVNQKGSTARLNLIPHNLGPLEIKLKLQGEASSIEFVTHHTATKEAIESAIPKLREMFESGGLSLGDVNVKDHSRHSKGGEQANYFTGFERRDNDASKIDESAVEVLNFVKKGRVDYFA